jgi:phosphopantothenoylcysteine synthetase/decarboxylase
MHVLVTAGNTLVPIDRVRFISNVFTGRTGAQLARCAQERGHAVTLLTSHPEVVDGAFGVRSYRTFEDLESLLEASVREERPDAVIHCAAVSDYRAAGIYAPAAGTHFDDCIWQGSPPRLVDRAAGKVKSDEPELWLRLERTPKLIDRFRGAWGFRGVLVKFKLEVGVDEAALQDIAEHSRRQSDANLLVANTLEGMGTWALLGPLDGRYAHLTRAELPERLFEAVERLHEERNRG